MLRRPKLQCHEALQMLCGFGAFQFWQAGQHETNQPVMKRKDAQSRGAGGGAVPLAVSCALFQNGSEFVQDAFGAALGRARHVRVGHGKVCHFNPKPPQGVGVFAESAGQKDIQLLVRRGGVWHNAVDFGPEGLRRRKGPKFTPFEVVVEQPDTDACSGGDIARAHSRNAIFADQVRSCGQNGSAAIDGHVCSYITR